MPLKALLCWLYRPACLQRPCQLRRGNALRLEPLEERTLPSTFTVLNGLDSGPGSLRQMVLNANANPGADTINFAHNVHSIALTSGELAVTDSLTIQGPGATQLAISGSNVSRVFDVQSGTVTISGLSILSGRADGNSPGIPSAGGGILNQAGASLTLANVVMLGNRAIGDRNDVVSVTPVFNLAGGAVGGGLASFGSLTVTGSTFVGNSAVGADHTDSSAFSFPGPAFPGAGAGGAISTYAPASITDTSFTGNLAQAGSYGAGDFAALGSGGAIYNDSALTIAGGTFTANLAIGGSNSVSIFHNGHGIGGAIISGSLIPLIGGNPASLNVSQTTFKSNVAIGGNNNHTLVPLPGLADGPDDGFGGAIIVYEGSAAFSQVDIEDNLAIGGTGGAAQDGSHGIGGGVFFFGFLGGVTATISASTISHNAAFGVAGGSGFGGGLALGSLGTPYGAPSTLTISATTVSNNLALGGTSSTGTGGNGLGGGLYIDAISTATVTGGTITGNLAIGGSGATGAGLGIGGGVYNLGVFDSDGTTVIKKNHASTSNDDMFP